MHICTIAVLFLAKPNSQKEFSNWRGIFFHYYPSIQSPVVCLFPCLFSWSFSFDVTEADCFYLCCNYDKNRAAPLSEDSHSVTPRWRRHYILTYALQLRLCPRAYTCFCITIPPSGSFSQPPPPRPPCGVFPWCSGAAQCVTDLRAGDTSRFGWQMWCILACCWKCDSPRLTRHTERGKKSSCCVPHSL